MQEKELIIKQLDLLVEMAEHCKNGEKTKDRCKCANCYLNWNFSLENHGCFLVETIDNNEKFLNDLINMCEYNFIGYKEKLNKITGMFEAL